MTRARKVNAYQIALHLLLVALALLVVFLSQQNRDLRNEMQTARGMAPAPGSEVASFAARNLEGQTQTIDLANSEKDNLLFIFTTTCSACQQNQSNWRAIYEENRDRYHILGISLSDFESTTTYRDLHDLPFKTVVADAPQDFADSIQISEIPFTVLVDRHGIVQKSWLGSLNKKSVDQLIGS